MDFGQSLPIYSCGGEKQLSSLFSNMSYILKILSMVNFMTLNNVCVLVIVHGYINEGVEVYLPGCHMFTFHPCEYGGLMFVLLA